MLWSPVIPSFKLGSVGHSRMRLSRVLAEIEAERDTFAAVDDGLSTKGATGKLVLRVLGAIAEFERSLIIERTQLARGGSQGRIGGRKRVMGTDDAQRGSRIDGTA